MNYINLLIPVTKNDELFIDYTGDSWCLNDKSFDERRNLTVNKIHSLGKQKNRDMNVISLFSYPTKRNIL